MDPHSGQIVYSLVAKTNGTPLVLAEFTKRSGNFLEITRKILDRIPSTDGKKSYVYDRYVFHYWTEDGLIFLCMTSDNFSRRIAFSFLQDIRSRFLATFGSRNYDAIGCEEFSRTLQRQMDYYSNDANADKIRKVRGEIDEVKTHMVQNIEKVLERGERIELLVDKTETLENTAVKFKTSSRTLKKAMWWKNARMLFILIILLILVAYTIAAIACGGLWFQKCIHRSSSSGTSTSESQDEVSNSTHSEESTS